MRQQFQPEIGVLLLCSFISGTRIFIWVNYVPVRVKYDHCQARKKKLRFGFFYALKKWPKTQKSQ